MQWRRVPPKLERRSSRRRSAGHRPGFAAEAEPEVAVCLLPGTELAFEDDVKYDHRWIWKKSTGFKVARFRKVELNVSHQHHDAIEFPNGSYVLVTLLSKSQRATVLQLPVNLQEPDTTSRTVEGSPQLGGTIPASAV